MWSIAMNFRSQSVPGGNQVQTLKVFSVDPDPVFRYALPELSTV
jgi:hypothetical protein